MDAGVTISLIRMAAADLTTEPWQRPRTLIWPGWAWTP